MSMHFVTNDLGRCRDHKARYDAIGRWLLALSNIAGWALGVLVAVPNLMVGLLFVFLAVTVDANK